MRVQLKNDYKALNQNKMKVEEAYKIEEKAIDWLNETDTMQFSPEELCSMFAVHCLDEQAKEIAELKDNGYMNNEQLETFNNRTKQIAELKAELTSNALQQTIDLTKAMSTAIDLSNAKKQIAELKEDRISLIMWVYEEVASHPLSLENADGFLEDYNKELNKH